MSQQVAQLTRRCEAAMGCGATHQPRPHSPMHSHPNARLTKHGRLLKPGGHLAITCPNLCSEHQTPYFFYSGFSRYFFINLIPENTGLKLATLRQQGDFISAHFGELSQLVAASESKVASALFKATLVTTQRLIRIIALASHTQSPSSCSGWFAIYTKPE